MHTKNKGARRRGRLPLGLTLAAAIAASLAIGVPTASATCAMKPTLTLTPSTQTHPVGQTASVTGTAKCGTAPLTNRPMSFKVVSGPNTGKTFTMNTNASGVAVFNYTSAITGTDKVGASIFATGGGGLTWTCCVDVIWTAPKPPLRYTGYAHNASASVKAPILGTLSLSPVNPIGPVDTPNATNQSNQIINLNGTILDAKVAETGVKTGAGSSTAFAKTAGASVIPLLGLVPALSNVDVLAESSATCAARTGKTTIASLTIGGTVLVGPGGSLATGVFVPAPNTTINLGILKVVLNEQTVSSTKVTVNAIHITLALPILGTSVDVIVSHAESDIHNC